jgi:UDP-sugar transporter A1/2/3
MNVVRFTMSLNVDRFIIILSNAVLSFLLVAPIAIIGGTASVYSSALNNSSSRQFTPISLTYLLLLAFNYAIMPRLSKRYIHPETDKRSVALAEEVVKMSIGVGGWVVTNWATCDSFDGDTCPAGDDGIQTTMQMTYRALSSQLHQWSPQSTLIAAGIPSLLYAIQGTLTYTAYQHLDSVTFNGLMQFKVLSSALGCFIILGQRLSGIQIGTLGLLMISTLVFQGSWKELVDRLWLSRSVVLQPKIAGRNDTKHNKITHFWLGVIPCLGATLLSGMAGAFSQKSLQTTVGSMMHRDAYFYTVEVSFLSAVCLLSPLLFNAWKRQCSDPKESHKEVSFFKHWSYQTFIPIATKAMAGVLTALVHKHLGSVVKGFALVLGLVFSALLQFALDGKDLTREQLVGTGLVLLSSWLHFRSPV